MEAAAVFPLMVVTQPASRVDRALRPCQIRRFRGVVEVVQVESSGVTAAVVVYTGRQKVRANIRLDWLRDLETALRPMNSAAAGLPPPRQQGLVKLSCAVSDDAGISARLAS
jgi:hypothetical protein